MTAPHRIRQKRIAEAKKIITVPSATALIFVYFLSRKSDKEKSLKHFTLNTVFNLNIPSALNPSKANHRI
jgi:hypothetical protein